MQIPYYGSGFYYTPKGYDDTSNTISGHRLPCLQQKNKFYNICFRLADSQPEHVLQWMESKLETWNNEHPNERHPTTARQRQQFRLMEYWLHQGHGSCILKDPRIQAILYQVILSHDEKECQIAAFVIMGNHVHLMVKMINANEMRDLVQKIKCESTEKINEYLNQPGKQIWMRGAFTRIIRSPSELAKTLKYICDNPKGSPCFTVYVRPDERPFL